MRPSRRAPDELRPVSLERGVVKYAEGSCMVKFGDTHVLVTATLEERLPPWLKGQGRGWVTAEYGMLPRATLERTRREASAGKQGGRTVEIQRLMKPRIDACGRLYCRSSKFSSSVTSNSTSPRCGQGSARIGALPRIVPVNRVASGMVIVMPVLAPHACRSSSSHDGNFAK